MHNPTKKAAPSAKSATSTTNKMNYNRTLSRKQARRRILTTRTVSKKLGVFWRVHAVNAHLGKCLECALLNVAGVRECTTTTCPPLGFRPCQIGGGQ